MKSRVVAVPVLLAALTVAVVPVAVARPKLERVFVLQPPTPYEQPEPALPTSLAGEPVPSGCGLFEFALDVKPNGTGVVAGFRNTCFPAVDMTLMVELILDGGRVVVQNTVGSDDSIVLSIPLAQIPQGAHEVTLRVMGTRTLSGKALPRATLYQAQQSRTFFR